MDTYGTHAVIANILETRKEKLWIVQNILGAGQRTQCVTKGAEHVIEQQIIEVIHNFHTQYRCHGVSNGK